MSDDESSSRSKRRLDAASSGANARIGVERGSESEDPFDVDELPDNPTVLKSRIERLEREIQHLVALAGGVEHASPEAEQSDEDTDAEPSNALEDLTTKLSRRLKSIEEDIASLEERQMDDGLLEEYNVGAILLQVQFIVGAFFIMLNFINIATAGGIALLFSTLLQFGHKIYLESEESSKRRRAKRDRL